MDPVVVAGGTPAAPAAASAPPPSASEAAVAANDFPAFRTAERAQRATGTPASPSAASTPAEPAAQVASTDASLEAASEPAKPKGAKARTAVLDAEIKDLQDKLKLRANLREELERRPADAKPAAPSAATAPATTTAAQEYKRYMAMPACPKLKDFDSIEEHSAAVAVFINDTRDTERATAGRQREQQRAAATTQQQRATTFSERLQAAAAADPTFVDAVSPEIMGLEPMEKAIALRKPITVDHGIAEEIIDSAVGPQLMRHLTDHPEDLAALRQAKNPRELARLVGQIEQPYLATPAAAAAPLKTVTDVAAPPTTLGTRPAASADPDPSRRAVINNDFTAFRASERAKRAGASR